MVAVYVTASEIDNRERLEWAMKAVNERIIFKLKGLHQ